MIASVKITQWPTAIAVEADQTVLEAALERGIPYPHGCRSGNCGACKSRLYAGSVTMEAYSDFALTPEERDEGFILACRAHAEGAVELAWLQDDAEAVAHPLRRVAGEVVGLDDLTHDIRRVRIALPPGQSLAFSAGQYASLTFADGTARDYSMANRPEEPVLEFHVRAVADGAASAYVHRRLAPGDRVGVEGPFGSSHLRERHRGPIVAVAGGSGLAPVKAIVETALAREMPQPILVYYGARDERDVYLEERFRSLAAAHPRLRFTVVLSEPSAPTARRTGLVSEALASDFDDFDGCKAYVAGPPVMVEAVTTVLLNRDIRAEDIHADAFYTEAEKAARNSRP